VSLNYLATRYTCSWPWTTAVMLCDGRVVCGCADPYAKRVLGDVRVSPLGDVWRGSVATSLRQDLNRGGSAFCGDCPLKLPLEDGEPVPQRGVDAGVLPTRLYIECTAACNISCFEACCAPETGITRTRQAGMLDFDLFARVVDEAAPALTRVDFFNYGEAFLHKRALEMCEYIKTRYPQIYLYTSTNGLALTEEKARQVVHTGIDEVTFSIDGASQDVYARYRQRGNFDRTIANLRAVMDEKAGSRRDLPFVNWRYILFRWNDSDAEMGRARQLARDIGVDRLCWEITDHPESAYSRRFAPGTADHASIRHEIWDDNNLGNAIPGAMPRARIELGAGDLVMSRGTSRVVTARVRNLSQRPLPHTGSHGRRLVRLGAQLCREDGTMVDRDFARAPFPASVPAGGRADVAIELQSPEPGVYLLRFDLVSEGVDWFEACGSEVTRRRLDVRG
jgi:hypothetical protein